MELSKVLRDLYAEKERLERTITLLEGLLTADPPEIPGAKRRGRHSMDAAERQEVSARMKRYWESRRNHDGGGHGQGKGARGDNR